MARFWVGPWVWDDAEPTSPHWRPPVEAIGCIDLRSLPQCAATVTPQGFGLFVTPNGGNLGAAYRNLGTDPEATLTEQQKRVWESAFGLPATLATNRLADVLYETLTLQADPTGDDRCLPLMPNRRLRFECWLSRAKVRDRPWAIDAPEFAPSLDVLKRVYRRLREAALAGQIPPDKYLRWLGFQVRKYGLTGNQYRALQPSDLPDETPLAPETSVGDSFNRSNNTDLNAEDTGKTLSGGAGTWDWTEVIGDSAIAISGSSWSGTSGTQTLRARAEQDLSGDDHYAECVGTVIASNSARYVAPCARFASAADTCYQSRLQGQTGLYQIYKVVTGTATALGTGATAAISVPETIRIECDGSSIEMFRGGASVEAITDTAITSGLRAGVGMNVFSTNTALDDFFAEDLAGGAIDLVVQDASHGHAADNLALTQAHALAVADAAHAHTAESPTLTQQHVIEVADALHAHAAESPALTQLHQLAVQDAAHAHAADNVVLSQLHLLAVADALHALTDDGPITLAAGGTLDVADALHAHAADNLTLTQAHVLAVQDALHAHAAEEITLTQLHELLVADGMHAHTADEVVLFFGAIVAAPGWRLAPRPRVWQLAPRARTWHVAPRARAWELEPRP